MKASCMAATTLTAHGPHDEGDIARLAKYTSATLNRVTGTLFASREDEFEVGRVVVGVEDR